MKKWWKLCLCIFLFSALFGCEKEEEVIPEPTHTVSETLQLYLDAMKQQDGVAMSEFTKSGRGDNFAISASDAQSLGLSETSAKALMNKIFSFTYKESSANTETDSTGYIVVDIQGYDVAKILDEAVKANEKAFEKIQKGKESDEEKAQMITDILLAAFDEAPLEKTFSYQFDVELIDNEWKINDEKINDFYSQLIGSFETEE